VSQTEIYVSSQSLSNASDGQEFDVSMVKLCRWFGVARRGFPRYPALFLLRSDNGLVFTSRHYTRLVRN